MNKRVLIVLAALAAVVLVLLLIRQAPPAPAEPAPVVTAEPMVEPAAPAAAPEPATEPTPEPVEAEVAVAPAPEATPVPESSPADAAAARSGNRMVFRGESFAVPSGAVLAQVHNTTITLKDLVPIAPGAVTEQTLSAADFQRLLAEAIDREVVFHTARARSVDLNEEQRRQVEKARLRAAAEGFSLPDDQRQAHEDRSNFASRALLGDLLLDRLVEQEGGPARGSVTEEAYQAESRRRLEAWHGGVVVIRNATVEP